jgi:hypothetical protein
MFTNYKIICRRFSLPRRFSGKFFAPTPQFASPDSSEIPFPSAAAAGDPGQSEQV